MSVCQLATMLMSITQHSPAIAKMSAAQSMLIEKGVVSHSIVIASQSEISVGCGHRCSWGAAHLVQTRAHSWNPKKPALMHTSMSGSAPASSSVGLQVMKNARGHLKMYAEAARKTPAEYTMCTRSAHHHALPSLPSRLHRCKVPFLAAIEAFENLTISL